MTSRTINSLVLVAGILVCGAVFAADHVDIGDPASEAGYVMSGWGPVEPANSGGGYGGIDHCRAIWSQLDGNRWAQINLHFDGGPEQVKFKHLEGIADDGFTVAVDGTVHYTHSEAGTTEAWYISGFDVSVTAGFHTVEFVATGDMWGSWDLYGQVCIAEVWVGDGGPIANEPLTWSRVKALFR